MGSPSARKSSTARSSVASAGTKGNPVKAPTTGRQTILPFVPVSKSQAIAIPLSPARKNNNTNPLLDAKALNYSPVKPSTSLKQTSLLSRLKSVKTNSTGNSAASKSTKENQPTSSSQPTADLSSSTGPRRTLKRSNSAFSSLDIVGKDWLQNAPSKKSCKVVNKTHVN